MATFVLVHGAWHGGWCWKKVTPLLRAAGHEVFTPTLTGLGERAHLLTPAVGLETHIEDVLGVLYYEDLRQVVLVGHSYGGMVITGVAGRAADRVAHLVYLDAFVPWEGQSLLDLMGVTQAAIVRERTEREGDGWGVPPLPLELFGVTEAADHAWAGPRIGMQPLKTFEQPLPQTGAAAALPRTYMHCAAWPGFTAHADRARTEPGWQIGRAHV
jgi:pimeloyl-ACP methyl ester carboxylesterase